MVDDDEKVPNSNWSLAGRHLRGKKGVFATDEWVPSQKSSSSSPSSMLFLLKQVFLKKCSRKFVALVSLLENHVLYICISYFCQLVASKHCRWEKPLSNGRWRGRWKRYCSLWTVEYQSFPSKTHKWSFSASEGIGKVMIRPIKKFPKPGENSDGNSFINQENWGTH